MDSISVVHVNIRGLRANRMNLIHYLEGHHLPDVVSLNETKMDMNQDIDIPNYVCVAQKGNKPHGSMIFVRRDIQDVSTIEELQNLSEETIGIKLNATSNRPTINVVTYYNPPGKFTNPQALNICRQLKGRTIVMGDFNSKNTGWGSTKTDGQGLTLLQTINDHHFIILNDGSKTRYDPVSGKEQVLDLCLVNSLMAKDFSEWQVDSDIGSDHYPLRASFSIGAPSESKTYRNIKDTDWKLFQESLDAIQVLQVSNPLDVETAVVALTGDIRQAFYDSCPEKVNKFRRKEPFTQEMLRIVREKRKLRREKANLMRNDDLVLASLLQREINKKNNELKKLQKINQKETLQRRCHELNKEKDSKRFFQLFNVIKGKNTTPIQSNHIQDGSDTATTDQEKADLFAKRLERLHQTGDDNSFSSDWKMNIEKNIEENKHIFDVDMSSTYSDPEEGDDSLSLSPITTEEIIENLKRCKNKSAAGEDGISYAMLKKLPKSTFQYITKIFNASLQMGYFPQAWKSARVKMVPKPGKDHKEAKNWRPISLLSCLGKLYERIVTNRLTSYLETNNLLSPFQSGFRKGRMTSEQLFRLAEDSYRSKKRKGVTSAIFLDAEAAFDQAWHNAIRYKVKEMKVPHRLVRLVSSFLKERSLTVNVGDKISNKVVMNAGTPQGSCLSPLLYIILVNDVPQPSNGTSIGQFADDIGLWAEAYTYRGCTYRLQQAINQLESWCRRWRIKLNGAKSNLLVFSRLPQKSGEDLSVQLFNDIVKPTTSAKYLGILFDDKLSFSEHFSQIELKATTRLNIFKILMKNGVEANTMIRLYKTYVRPLFEYGSISFLPSHGIKRLQSIQNEFIRISLKIPRYIRTSLIHEAAGMELVCDRICSLNSRLMKKMNTQTCIAETITKSNNTIPLNSFKSPLDILTQYQIDKNMGDNYP